MQETRLIALNYQKDAHSNEVTKPAYVVELLTLSPLKEGTSKPVPVSAPRH